MTSQAKLETIQTPKIHDNKQHQELTKTVKIAFSQSKKISEASAKSPDLSMATDCFGDAPAPVLSLISSPLLVSQSEIERV